MNPGPMSLSRLVSKPLGSLLTLLMSVASLVALPAWASAPGTWAPLENLSQPRAGHSATLLANGTVLIAGGKNASGQPLASVELYNPVTGHYAPLAAALPTAVWGHTATLLPDGTVLIAGGSGPGGLPVSDAQLFDPATATFIALPAMSTPRSGHSASLLGDGLVLIAGGTDGLSPLATMDLFDPATRTFSAAPITLAAPRQGHSAVVLSDGRVLVVGGADMSGPVGAAEVVDPGNGTVMMAGSLNVARSQASAALLLDGRVLVVGGQDAQGQDLASAEVFDATATAFALLPVAMSSARSGHVGVQLLHNGKVLLAGGTVGGQLVSTAEVYDPVTGTFAPVGSPTQARDLLGTNFLALPYTGILVVSGGVDDTGAPLAASEMFFYPTLRSDKPDYQPGDTVTLMGEGWNPGETVTITIRESSGDPDIALSSTADANGAFTNSLLQINDLDVGVRFFATATGQTSTWTAQTTFTDSRTINSVKLNGGTAWTPLSPSTTGTAVTVLPGALISAEVKVTTDNVGKQLEQHWLENLDDRSAHE